jgi:hypothetical protein
MIIDTLLLTHIIIATHYYWHTLLLTHIIIDIHYYRHTLLLTYIIIDTHYYWHTLLLTYMLVPWQIFALEMRRIWINGLDRTNQPEVWWDPALGSGSALLTWVRTGLCCSSIDSEPSFTNLSCSPVSQRSLRYLFHQYVSIFVRRIHGFVLLTGYQLLCLSPVT